MARMLETGSVTYCVVNWSRENSVFQEFRFMTRLSQLER